MDYQPGQKEALDEHRFEVNDYAITWVGYCCSPWTTKTDVPKKKKRIVLSYCFLAYMLNKTSLPCWFEVIFIHVGTCVVACCIIMLEIAIRSNDWLVSTGPKHAKKTFRTPLHHLQQPGMLTQGRLGPFMFVANWDPVIFVPQQKSRYIRPS